MPTASPTQLPWNDVGGAPCCCVEEPSCTPINGGSGYRNVEITAAQYAELYAGGTAQCVFMMSGASTFNRSSTCYTIDVSGTAGGTADFVMVPNLCNRDAFGGTQPPATLASSGSASGSATKKTPTCTIPTFIRTRSIPSAWMAYGIYNQNGLYPHGLIINLNFSGRISHQVGSFSAEADLGAYTSTLTPNSTVLLKLQSGNIAVPTINQVQPGQFQTPSASWLTYPEVTFTPSAP